MEFLFLSQLQPILLQNIMFYKCMDKKVTLIVMDKKVTLIVMDKKVNLIVMDMRVKLSSIFWR